MTEHHRLVEQQFARQASGFGQEGLTLTNRDHLAWMVDMLDLDPHDAVLDVAAGTGHLVGRSPRTYGASSAWTLLQTCCTKGSRRRNGRG